MSILRRITNLFHRSKLEQEIEAELRSHIEMRTADNMAAGMSPEEARRDASVLDICLSPKDFPDVCLRNQEAARRRVFLRSSAQGKARNFSRTQQPSEVLESEILCMLVSLVSLDSRLDA
jgi:hypothetical protein